MASVKDELKEIARGWRWGRRPLVPRSALPYAPEPEPDVFPTAWARTPAAGAAREVILRYGLKPVVWSETSPRLYGLDRLNGVRGPVLFVSNHTSHLDASLIMTSMPDRFREKTAVGAAKDYFFDVWWRSAFTALVYAGFPIDRTGVAGATDTAKELVRDGWSLVVFPEGGRSPDGWTQRFRHGTARLSLELGVPVVPIGIRGAFAAMPKGRSWPKAGRPPISVRYGRPLYPDEGATHQDLSRRMTQAIAALLDEDRTTWWEAIRRADRGETPASSGPQGPSWLRVWEASKAPRSGAPSAWK